VTRLAIFNQKGGVGKTTTTLNLGAALAARGVKPLLVDLDPQAHLTQVLGAADGGANLFAFYAASKAIAELTRPIALSRVGAAAELVAGHAELAKVETLFGKGPRVLYRLKEALNERVPGATRRPVLIDCCPMLGLLSLAGIFATDKVLVPISADHLAVRGALALERTLGALEQVLKKRVERRYVLTRFDRRRKMAGEIELRLRERFGAELCATRIHENVALAESPYYGKDVFAHDANSRGAGDYEQLAQELIAAGFLALPADALVGAAGTGHAPTPSKPAAPVEAPLAASASS
jgi:chromosome partitioning protein